MCQEFPKEKWVDARREDILDAPYFHVVFTVPEELNPIIYSNQKFLYLSLIHISLLFQNPNYYKQSIQNDFYLFL